MYTNRSMQFGIMLYPFFSFFPSVSTYGISHLSKSFLNTLPISPSPYRVWNMFFLPCLVLLHHPSPLYIFIKSICMGCGQWFVLYVWAAWCGRHITISLNGIICPLQTVMLTNSSINMCIPHSGHDENIGYCAPLPHPNHPPQACRLRRGWSYHHSSCPPPHTHITLRMNNNGDRPWLAPWGEMLWDYQIIMGRGVNRELVWLVSPWPVDGGLPR